MAPRIPIIADPSQAVAAFEKITAAMRRVGQEGKALSELDLSHPELKGLADDIRRLQSNFQSLGSLGRAGVGGVSKEVSQGNYRDVIDWYQRHKEKFKGDEAGRARHFNAVAGYVTYGSRWNPQPPHETGKSGGMGGMPIPGMKSMIKPLLALAGVGGVLSVASQAIDEAQTEATQADTLKRVLADTSTEFATFRDLLRESSEGLQLTHTETVRLAQSFAKASGLSGGIAKLVEETRDAVGFGRSFGMDPNQTSQLFGQARWFQAGDGLNAKELGIVFADAIASGGMWSKADEVLSAIIGWVQTSERTIVDSPNIHAYASMQAAMNASNRPGLQGQAGAALLGTMDQAIRQGGGAGEAGQIFLLRAMQREGKLDPFKMEYLIEGGMFGSRKRAFGEGSDTTNAELIFSELRKQYANPFVRASAAGNLMNISMRQAMAMDQVSDDPRKFGSLMKMLDKFNIAPETLNTTGIQALSKLAIADTPDALQQVKADILAREDVSAEDKDRLAGTFFTDKGLREALANTLAGLSRETNVGMETQDAMVNFKRALTESGANLLTTTNFLKAGVTKAITGLNVTIDVLSGVVGGKSAPGYRGSKSIFDGLPTPEEWRDDMARNHRGRRPEMRLSELPEFGGMDAGSQSVVKLEIAPVEFTLKDQSGRILDTQMPEISVGGRPKPHGGKR